MAIIRSKRVIKIFTFVALLCIAFFATQNYSSIRYSQSATESSAEITEMANALNIINYDTAWTDMKLDEIACLSIRDFRNINPKKLSPFRFRYVCASPDEFSRENMKELMFVQHRENETFRVILRYAQKHPNTILLDIGANIGALSIPLANAEPTIRIVAIEPMKKTLRFLTKAIILNGLQERILLLNHAIYDVPFKHLTMISYSNLLGYGRIDVPTIYKLPDRTKDRIENKVRSITFDEIIELVKGGQECIVKIDVEGAECIAFRRIDKFLSVVRVPIIITETNKLAESDERCVSDMLQKLRSHGYIPYNGDKWSCESGQLDIAQYRSWRHINTVWIKSCTDLF